MDIKTKLREIGALISRRRAVLVIALVVAGVILLLVSFSVPSDKTEQNNASTLDEYKGKLESELSELCSRVEGAGKCMVSVSFSEGERIEYRGGAPVVTHPPKIGGITVLCRGGARDDVRSELSEMLSALYGIGQNRICILKLS